jgi:hypothetical protein
MPAWLERQYPADQRAAVDYLRERVDLGMLREIAAADYGQDIDKHLDALLPVWEGGEFVALDHWFPMEVLELVRWSAPGGLDANMTMDTRGHLIRAYSCAVLLTTPNYEPEKETLIQMLDSMLLLGGDAPVAMACFLTWRIQSLAYDVDRPFFALALASITLLDGGDVTACKEYDLEQWVVEEEAYERDYLGDYGEDLWLFGLSHNDMLNARWMALLNRLKQETGHGAMASMLQVKLGSV